MADTWHSSDEPTHPPLTPLDWLRVLRRAIPLIVLVFGGLVIMLILRLIERPIFGMRRPVTPYLTQFVCRGAFFILGIGYNRHGSPMTGAGAVVSNHVSWLAIFALNAAKRIYFVAKSEVSGWPGIGWLARATGTVFIRRSRSDLTSQIAVFQSRLAAGHRLLFFPEGTSTDGLQVLPFKPALFQAFFDPTIGDDLSLQAVTLYYAAPNGEDPRFYGWWGDMTLPPHLLATLAARKQGSVHVTYHPPVARRDFADRKALSQHLEAQVRSGLTQHRLT